MKGSKIQSLETAKNSTKAYIFLNVNLLFVFVPRCNGRVEDEFPGDEIILVVSLSLSQHEVALCNFFCNGEVNIVVFKYCIPVCLALADYEK